MSRRRNLSFVLRAAFAIGLLYYLITTGVLDWKALAGLWTAWPTTLGAVGLMLLVICFTSWRLSVLLEAQSFHLRIFDSIRLTFIGSFFNLCLPGSGGGDAVRLYYGLASNPGRRMEIATIMLLDRVFGLFGLLLYPLLIVPFFPGVIGSAGLLYALLGFCAAFAAIMLIGFSVSLSVRFRRSRILEWLLYHMPLRTHLERIIDTIHGYRHRKTALLKAVGISLLAHTTGVLITILVASAMQANGLNWKLGLVVPLGFIANTLPVTPGGLGVGEAAFNKLFSMAGLSGGAEVLLGWRLILALVSLPGFALYMRGKRDYIAATRPQPHELRAPVEAEPVPAAGNVMAAP